jgi:phage I-like protein
MIPVEVAADGSVPTEFCLLKAGINSYSDGDKILFDDEAAAETMRRYQARGVDLMADYEHQSLNKSLVGGIPASAKKWVPEVRSGALMAASVSWTDKAKSMLAAGEYRFFSIACRVDEKTGRCVELINFALTNLPAGNDIAPLMAASMDLGTETNMPDHSESVYVALGLKPDADSETAINTAGELATLKRQVLAITKTTSIADAIGAVQAHAATHERYQVAESKLHVVETSQREGEFDALMRQADLDGKMTPAMAKGEWIAEMRTAPNGVATLKSFLARAPVVVSRKTLVEEAGEADNVELTDAEITVAKKMTGDDSMALKKRLDMLRASKLEEIKMRKAARL